MLVAYEGCEQQSVKGYQFVYCCEVLDKPTPLVLGFLTSEIGVLHGLV